MFAKFLQVWNLIIHNIYFTLIIYGVNGNDGELESVLNSSVNSGSTQQHNSVVSTSEHSLENKRYSEKEIEAKIAYLSGFSIE